MQYKEKSLGYRAQQLSITLRFNRGILSPVVLKNICKIIHNFPLIPNDFQ